MASGVCEVLRGIASGRLGLDLDLIESSIPEVQSTMRLRYGEYLTQLKDEAYRDQVFAYIKREDTPRSLMFQLDLLREVGFSKVEVLHKNSCFAAFGAVKASTSL